jgi:hypothetical protein
MHCGMATYTVSAPAHPILPGIVPPLHSLIHGHCNNYYYMALSSQPAQISFELLIDSAKRGGPLAGVMFWNAAANFTGDWDGYGDYRGTCRTIRV